MAAAPGRGAPGVRIEVSILTGAKSATKLPKCASAPTGSRRAEDQAVGRKSAPRVSRNATGRSRQAKASVAASLDGAARSAGSSTHGVSRRPFSSSARHDARVDVLSRGEGTTDAAMRRMAGLQIFGRVNVLGSRESLKWRSNEAPKLERARRLPHRMVEVLCEQAGSTGFHLAGSRPCQPGVADFSCFAPPMTNL